MSMTMSTPAETAAPTGAGISSAAAMAAPLSDLYQEVIMEHYRRPRHKGKPSEGCQYCQDGKNPLCGDQITLFCRVQEAEGGEGLPRVSLGFDGHGCSISQASASMLCESVQGLSVPEAREVVRHAEGVYTGRSRPELEDDIERDVDALFGVSKFPVRVKCAALAWKTFELILADKFTEEGTLKEPEGACSTLRAAPGCAREQRRTLRVVSTED
jgi:nitrogen fixation protein NifU and related proteins